MSEFYKPFETINTKVVGVMSGEDAATRQLGIEYIQKAMDAAEVEGLAKKERRFFIDLVPEPDNAYDKDAIQCLANVPGLGRTQIGYISNAETECDFCHHRMPAFPKGKPPLCPRCKRSDHLRRDGLASQISKVLREDPGKKLYGEVLQCTGGSEEKTTWGLNMAVKAVFKRRGES